MNKIISLGLALLFSCSFFSCGIPESEVGPQNSEIGDASDKNSVVSGTRENNQVVPELDIEKKFYSFSFLLKNKYLLKR